ncbi:response regulator transcription factor [Flavobacterium sp. DG1-102-2]|uniref:response regulator transcription factor n=1 Tax=Flavobacterium sp. DG1-102-2 TaxID=3081663 RepID=UPI00294A4F9D|nr:response regulator transcription factor [Flavobacterium sp. DG1-102-2]MDV6170196.1 response regulator transcription factor [Flavobacterium sp. DG1-102-2]
MTILIADDHSVVRQGVSLILRDTFEDISIDHSENFSSTLKMLETRSYDMLMLDINLPDGNTVSMITECKAIDPEVKILMFSAYDEDQYALRYIQAGASGYLNKLSSEEKIIEAVTTVINGGIYSKNELKGNSAGFTVNPLDALSNRELEIAALLVKGEGNLEIANKLDIRMSTVSTYKSRIFEKLGVTNVVMLAEKYKLHIS